MVVTSPAALTEFWDQNVSVERIVVELDLNNRGENETYSFEGDEIIDLSPGQLFVLGDATGPLRIVRGDSYAEAIEAAIESLHTGYFEVPDDEADEELGSYFDGGRWLSEASMANFFVIELTPKKKGRNFLAKWARSGMRSVAQVTAFVRRAVS